MWERDPPSYYDSFALSIGWGCDTIYAVSHNGIEPRYILNYGRYDAPFEIKYGYSFDQDERERIMEKDTDTFGYQEHQLKPGIICFCIFPLMITYILLLTANNPANHVGVQ
jgi:hypothetical protein